MSETPRPEPPIPPPDPQPPVPPLPRFDMTIHGALIDEVSPEEAAEQFSSAIRSGIPLEVIVVAEGSGQATIVEIPGIEP